MCSLQLKKSRSEKVKKLSFNFENVATGDYFTYNRRKKQKNMPISLPHLKFVWNRYGQATQRNGKDAVVELRIIFNKRAKYMSTGIRLKYSQWRDGMIINHEDCVELNRLLDSTKKKVYDIINDMLQEGEIDIFAIPMRIKKKEIRQNFAEFIRRRAEVRAFGKAEPVQDRYRHFVDFLFNWGRIKNFEDITDTNVIAFERFLISRGLKASSRWHLYHRFLNSFILDAINEGIISHNPYKYVRLNHGDESEGLNKCLTPEEFGRLRTVELPTEALRQQRDVFVVQTFLGMAYQDLTSISRKNVQDVAGIPVFIGERHKTGGKYTKPILPDAQAILERYDYKLPVKKKATYNGALKLIAKAAGIDKPLTSHWARHTGATLLLNSGVELHTVSKILGHKSIHITEKTYAKLLDVTIAKKVINSDINKFYNNQNNQENETK